MLRQIHRVAGVVGMAGRYHKLALICFLSLEAAEKVYHSRTIAAAGAGELGDEYTLPEGEAERLRVFRKARNLQ